MQEIESNYPKPMSVKDWLITMLLIAIPVVGIVLLFVYAFGSNENPNKQNWAKAQLLLAAIVLAIILVILMLFGSIYTASSLFEN